MLVPLLSFALALPFAGDQVVFTHDANLRAAASTDAEVVAKLPLGTPVEVLETGKVLSLWGRRAPWVKVKADGHEGWLWSGLVTRNKVDLGGGNGFVAGARGVKPAEYDQFLVSVEVAGRVDGKLLAPARWDLTIPVDPSESTNPFFMETKETKLDAAPRVVTVSFIEEFCGGMHAAMQFGVADGSLHYWTTLGGGSDAPYFAVDELLFPADDGGKPGLVLHHEYSGYYSEDSDEPVIESDETKEHRVVKGKLVPPIE